MLKTKYVWYASYGSNLSRDRFLCYIRGGKPKGGIITEIGCHDQSLPIKEEPFKINYPLYFAKKAAKWQGQGVAFIGKEKVETETTYSMKYLITVDQFLDVVKQENKKEAINLDLEQVITKGALKVTDSWYSYIIYLGESDGCPIFTFTSDWQMGEIPFEKPSEEYLGTIITGIKTFLSKEDAIRYLLLKPGIKDQYRYEELEAMYEIN